MRFRFTSLACLIGMMAVGLFPGAVTGDTMRCGRWVVSSSTPPSEILEKCGTPTSKQTEISDVWARNPDGTPGTQVIGQTVTERWTYARGPRRFTMVFTIRDGRTIGLESIRR